MPPFNELDLSHQEQTLKFLRINSSLFVTSEPITHRDLAKTEGVFDEYRDSMRTDKTSVDAGFVEVDGSEIKISGRPTTILVYELDVIRETTIKTFAIQAPNHHVTGRSGF